MKYVLYDGLATLVKLITHSPFMRRRIVIYYDGVLFYFYIICETGFRILIIKYCKINTYSVLRVYVAFILEITNRGQPVCMLLVLI